MTSTTQRHPLPARTEHLRTADVPIRAPRRARSVATSHQQLVPAMGPPNRAPGMPVMGFAGRSPEAVMGGPDAAAHLGLMGVEDQGAHTQLFGYSDPSFVDSLFAPRSR